MTMLSDRPSRARPAHLDAPAPGTPVRRAAPRGRRRALRATDALAIAAGVGLGVTIATGVVAESAGSLAAPGGWLVAAGRMTGLVGAYLLLVVLVLIARIPWLDRALGHDRLVALHRTVAPWPLVLLVLHAVLLSLGYAATTSAGGLAEFWSLVTQTPNVLAATVALVLMLLAGFTSYRIARRRMKYETWWAVHLYTYLAIALGFAHQLTAGASFIGHPLSRAFWIALWGLSVGTVVVYRFGLPLWRTLRHGLRVVAVHEEAPGVVSVVVAGRALDRLPLRGGQFLQWRFLRRGQWWQAHPYSLSAMPRSGMLRVTVKDLGDHSRGLAAMPVGTRVAIEGPYGVLTDEVRASDKVLLVGGGVGVTPLLALLEDLPTTVHPVVIVRASSEADLVLLRELDALARAHGGVVHALVGHRDQVPLDRTTIARLVPDVSRRDVYVCGPDGMTRDLERVVAGLGVPRERFHHETFTF
jgi:predicted ferric reductase